MQTLLTKFAFSKFSHKNQVPRILQHGRFTKDGFNMLGTNRKASINFVPRRLTRIMRPVDLSQVENAHLYFNHKTDVEQKISLWMEKRKARQNLLVEAPGKEYIVEMIKNQENLAQSSWKLLFGLKLLHKHYPQEIEVNREHIDYALARINQQITSLDIHNFRSVISFAKRYLNEDKKVWQLYLQNTVRFILSHEQQQKPLLGKDIKEDQKDDFIKIFHVVVERAIHMDIPLEHLIAQLDMMMRNHFREVRTLVNPPSPNSISNLQVNQAALFQSDFIRVMLKRKDFYNDHDTTVKHQQVQTIIADGQKSILDTKEQLTSLALKSLKSAYSELKGTKYLNKDLIEFSKKLALQ